MAVRGSSALDLVIDDVLACAKETRRRPLSSVCPPLCHALSSGLLITVSRSLGHSPSLTLAELATPPATGSASHTSTC